MEIKTNLDYIKKALLALHKSIDLYDKCEETCDEDVRLAFRDSMIQRFEISIDLLWKTLKNYLENIEKISLSVYSPKSIIRDAAKSKFISEKESQELIKMIDSRNQTSHIYHEEIADQISKEIPEYYDLMQSLIKRMESKI